MVENESNSEQIDTKSIEELVRTIEKTSNGSFAFLIGAGASRPEPSEIPTAGELIEQFQQELYEEKDPDEDLEEWSERYEEENKEDYQNEYGFWFSEAYPTPGSRREMIQEMVQEEEPPPGQVVLANMMNEGVVSHTFTPNFDDLLYDALYNISDTRPLFIDHEAKAPRFNMSGEHQTIVKLHGDYLHYTQNTTEETTELKTKVKDRFRQSLTEYGLVVVGYGGTDDSIMSVLEEVYLNGAESEHGLFWCKRGDIKFDEDEQRLKEFLEKSDKTYAVPIEGSKTLFANLWGEVDDVKLPQAQEIMESAEERKQKIKNLKSEFEEVSGSTEPGQTESGPIDTQSQLWDANDAIVEGDYENAIEIADEVISENGDSDVAYAIRGVAKKELEEYEEAIEEFNQAINLNADDHRHHFYRGLTYYELERYQLAIENFDRAVQLKSDEPNYFYYLARSKFHVEEYEEAIKDIKQGIKNEPDNKANYYNMLGQINIKMGEVEDAIDSYDTAIELTENDIRLLNRAEARLINEQYDKALNDAKKGYKKSSKPTHRAISLLILCMSNLILDEDIEEIESEYRDMLSESSKSEWDFEEIEAFLEGSDIETEKREKIRELVDAFPE